MTNEMKLLMAMCDAMGFEVERTVDYQEKEISEQEAEVIIRGMRNMMELCFTLEMDGGRWKRGKDGCYFRRLKEPVTDYKVTKKAESALEKTMREAREVERYRAMSGRNL